MRLTRLFATTDLEYLDKEGADFYRELVRKVDPKLHSQPEALKLYMERIRSLVLSDRVGFYFNISARVENDRVILEGESEGGELFSAIWHGLHRGQAVRLVVDNLSRDTDGARYFFFLISAGNWLPATRRPVGTAQLFTVGHRKPFSFYVFGAPTFCRLAIGGGKSAAFARKPLHRNFGTA